MKMRISSQFWRGYIAAVVTPFDRTSHVDEKAFATVLEWLLSEGIHGLTVAGTTGEWTSLSAQERVRLFERARVIWPTERPLFAGCSALNITETLRFLDAAEVNEFDAALITIPPYLYPNDREIINYFEIIARCSKLPLIVYNWPLGTGKDLSLSVLSELLKLPGIKGVKHSTSSIESFESALCSLGDKTQFFGIMPGARGLQNLRRWGGAGCIGASGALGRYQAGFFEAAWRGEDGEALLHGSVDEAFMNRFFVGFEGRYGHAIATIKALMRLRGLPVGYPRAPLMDLDDQGLRALREFINEFEIPRF